MHFKIGAPADDAILLKNPTKLMPQPIEHLALFGTVLGVLFVISVFLPLGLWGAVHAWSQSVPALHALGLFLAIMLAHEALHMVAYQGFNWRQRGTFGIIPKAFMAYAYYPFVVSRSKFIFAAALPSLALTGLPLAFHLAGHSLFEYDLALAALNALVSGGDLFIIWTTLKKVPSGMRIQSSGTSEYWGDPAY